MNKDEILNRLSLKKHNIHFNQIVGMYDRAVILDEALDEVLKKANLTIPDAGLSLPDTKLINLIDYCKKFTDGSKTSEQLEMWKKWEDANFLDNGKLLSGNES